MKTNVTLGTLFNTRKNNLNFLRLFFAVAVIFSHSYPLAWSRAAESIEPLSRLSHGQIDFGRLAVDSFFVMSGFLLVISWQNSSGFVDFMTRRVLRVYPGLTVCVAVCVLIVGPLGGADLHHYYQNPKNYLLFEYLALVRFINSISGIFAHNPQPEIINSSLWTIKYEIFCYIILALMGVLKMLKPRPLLIVLSVAYLFFNVTSLLNIHLPLALDPFFMPRLLTYFLMGSAFCLLRDKIPFNKVLLGISILLIALTMYYGLNFTLPICGTYCLLYIAFSPRIPLYAFGRSWDLSYGTYLYAWPIQQLLLYYFPALREPVLLCLAAIPCTLLVAALSWAAVERPFLEIKKRQLKRQKAELGA